MKNGNEQKAAFVRLCGLHLHHRTNNPCLTPLFISLHPFKGLEEERNEERLKKPCGNGNICSAVDTRILYSHFLISRPHWQPHDLLKEAE